MRVWFAALFLLTAALSAGAQQPLRPSQAICDAGKLSGRPYALCLEKAMRDSNSELEALVERIMGFIEMRADLQQAQKIRWKSSLEEAQILFVRFRNQECQSVAPFEGTKPPEGPRGGRIGFGSFEERLLCLIDKNVARTRELEARYVK
jgi:uncharacterized protein YecT (DUF1311 family)